MSKSIFNPGWGQSESPNHSEDNQDGTHTLMWFRPKDAPKPEHYDHAHNDKRRPGWMVYYLTVAIGIFLCIPSWCVVRLFKGLAI